jgi:tetratricopeptide (TPR) repeat protein
VHYDTALAIANRSGNAFEVARIQDLLGFAYLSLGEMRVAEAFAAEALRSAEHTGWLDLQISAHLSLLKAAMASGDKTTALEHGRKALDSVSGRPPDTARIDVELELARLHLIDGDLDAAKPRSTGRV